MDTVQRFELAKFISDNAYNINGNTLNEAVQANMADAVLFKMFEMTIGKYNKIDFGDIERSRGNVTKTKFYKNLNECINTLIDIHTVTDKIPSILIVSDALANLLAMKNTFEYNFRIKNNCAIMVYNSIYYAIMEATSYIIATSIDFAKSENDSTFDNVTIHGFDSKCSCLINALSAFNKCVADNSIMKFLKESAESSSKLETQTESVGSKVADVVLGFVTNNKDSIKKYGAIAATAIFSIYVASNIIPIIREIIYWIFKARHKISEAAALQAKFLELNIESLEHLDKNAVIGRRKITTDKLITRQTRYAKMFRSIANKFALDSDKSDRDAKLDIKQDKVDVSNVVI